MPAGVPALAGRESARGGDAALSGGDCGLAAPRSPGPPPESAALGTPAVLLDGLGNPGRTDAGRPPGPGTGPFEKKLTGSSGGASSQRRSGAALCPGPPPPPPSNRIPCPPVHPNQPLLSPATQSKPPAEHE